MYSKRQINLSFIMRDTFYIIDYEIGKDKKFLNTALNFHKFLHIFHNDK